MLNLILVIFILFFNLFVGVNSNVAMRADAASAVTYYAQVIADNVYLYRNAIDSEDFSNIYFELPRTYFVELLDNYNTDFYLARYLGIKGYVKKDSVTAISGTPITAFLTSVNLRVYSEQSQNMRRFPTSAGGSENQECFLPQNNLNITYIGKIYGEQLVKNRTNVWYFCSFTDSQEHFGYVYSEFCDDGEGNDIFIPTNNEPVTYITNPEFFEEPEQQTSLPVESKTTWIVIAVLSVPAVIFILMFLKGGKVLKKDKKVINKEVRDY